MANRGVKKQSNSIYYNIDIYNDNSTNADISSKFQTAFNSPLLMDTSNYEVAVARARIPLDQIPLSQENIPFNKWQIEIGVPLTEGYGYTYYNSYVPQFLPRIVENNYNTATLGINNLNLGTMTILAGTSSPSGTVVPTITPSSTPPQQGFTTTFDFSAHTNVSNIAYSQNYIVECTDTRVFRFTYDKVLIPSSTWDIQIVMGTSARIVAMCASQLRDNVYVLGYQPDAGGSWTIVEIYEGGGAAPLPLNSDGNAFPSNIGIYSMSCSDQCLSVTVNKTAVSVTPDITLPIVYTIVGQITRYNVAQPYRKGILLTYLDSENLYYQAGTNPYHNATFRMTDKETAGVSTKSFNVPDYQNNYIMRFLGSDEWNNLLVCIQSSVDNTYSIVAYDKVIGETSDPIYTIQMGSQNPVSLTKFTATPAPPTLSPSLSPNYQVMTINQYLRQINLAFGFIFSQIPLPYSSPTAAPRLVYNSATAIVSIVTDVGCASSLTTACVINFNQLLWSLFKFNSIAAVNTALPSTAGVVRTLTIDNAILPANLTNTPQPNSTMYRFSDLTRIIIGTTRMGVLGDNQNNDKLLVNIGDFTVDTEEGIPNLIIYNPFILRYYKLYQNTPLTNIDVFVSYANRAGEVFPITISPYNSIGLKLEFHRIPLIQ